MEQSRFELINLVMFTPILKPHGSQLQRYHVIYRGFIKSTQSKKLRHGLKKTVPKLWEQQSEYHFAITEVATGSVLGGCGLDQINWVNQTANLGYWVRTSRTRQGVATAASKLLVRFGFEHLQLKRIDVVTSIDNIPSARVAEKLNPSKKKRVKNSSPTKEDVSDTIVFSIFSQDVS
jgi:RimJ/RimL family protein N-acetyltransferase